MNIASAAPMLKRHHNALRSSWSTLLICEPNDNSIWVQYDAGNIYWVQFERHEYSIIAMIDKWILQRTAFSWWNSSIIDSEDTMSMITWTIALAYRILNISHMFH